MSSFQRRPFADAALRGDHITHVISRARPSRFSVYNIESWKWAGDAAILMVSQEYITKESIEHTYAPCKENYPPGKTLTSENVRFKYSTMGVASSASKCAISSENARRTQYRTSVQVGKTTLFFHSWVKH